MLARDRRRDRAFERRVAAIVDRVRRGGDRRCSASRSSSTASSRRSRSRATRCAASAATVPARGAPRDPPGRQQHRARRRSGRFRSTGISRSSPGVTVEQRVEPLGARRLLRARRPLSAALFPADDGGPGARRRRPRDRRGLPATGTRGHGRGARGRRVRACSGSAARTPLRRSPTAPRRSRAWTRSSAPATATSRPPRRSCRPTARSISTPARPRSSSSPARGRAEWIAADLVAQAEHDPEARSIFITWSARPRQPGRRASWRGWPQAATSCSSRSRPTASPSSTRDADEAMELANRIAPEHLVVDREALMRRPIVAGAVFVGPFTAQAAGDYATGSNHVLPTSGAARFRGGLERRRLRPRHGGAAGHPGGPAAAGADDRAAGARGRTARARRIDRGSPVMTEYDKPPELYAGLRLHQNENTGGCSPRVLEALARLTPSRSAVYPPYAGDGRRLRRARRRRPGRLLAGQRARRRHPGGRGRAICGQPATARSARSSFLNRRSRSSKFDAEVRRRTRRRA